MDDRARFAEETRALLEERAGAALFVGAFVFPIFFYQDRWLVPDDWREVFLLRVGCSLTCVLAWAVRHTAPVRRHLFAFVVTVMATVSVIKAFTTAMDVTGVRALYFGGHALIFAGSLAMLPLTLGQALVLSATCVLAYAAPTLLFSAAVDPVAFKTQVGLLTAIGGLLSIGRHLDHGIRWREFAFRSRLYRTRRRAEDYGWDLAAHREGPG